MPWGKIDDLAHAHRKQRLAGIDAVGLWAMSISYCSFYGTDGKIKREELTAIFPLSPARAKRLAAKLVEVKLWDETPDGWVVHDFLDYNLSAREFAELREKKVEAGKRGGRRSAEARKAKREADAQARATADGQPSAPADAQAKVKPVPVPVPGPVPLSGGLLSPPEPPRGEAAAPPARRRGDGGRPAEAKSAETWRAYADAYTARYGVPPVRNGKTNALLAHLVDRLGAEEAPQVAAWYVSHPRALYVAAKHAVDLLVRDAEGLRTEWATGRIVTTTQARQADQTATNAETLRVLLAERAAREADRR